MDGLIYTDPRIHPELVAELLVTLLEEETPGPISARDTKTLDPNAITAASDTNSDIANTKVVHDDSNVPTPIFTINPTPEAENNYGREDSYDDSEDNDNYDDKVKKVQPPEQDTPETISIESHYEGSDY